jgi:sodium/potassium-transporting ATPase subunit alpha
MHIRAVWYLQRNGVLFSSLVLTFGDHPATLTSDLLHEAQSVYFFTLIVMQLGCAAFSYHISFCFMLIRFPRSNLLSTRTRRSSIVQQRVNRTTIPAALCSLAIAIFFSYVPFLYVPLLAIFPFCSRS